MSTPKVPMSFITKIQHNWFSHLASHSNHIYERRSLLYKLNCTPTFFTTETFAYHNYFLDLSPFFHLIEFKFKLRFSFSKMCLTISSLNINYYKHNSIMNCRFFRVLKNMWYWFSWPRVRYKLIKPNLKDGVTETSTE